LAQSRKRKKERRRAEEARRPAPAVEPAAPTARATAEAAGAEPAAGAAPVPATEPAPRGYARGRAKSDAARAALKPLAPGERPTAVTVGAVAAGLLAASNLIAVIAGWDGAAGSDDRARAIAGSLLVTGLLCAVAWGMWNARYWAVLGMQTLLALTLIAATLGLATAGNAGAMAILAVIIVAAGTLFWFMVKAMARIQMPERPSRAR
jgi:hypothetical protein